MSMFAHAQPRKLTISEQIIVKRRIMMTSHTKTQVLHNQIVRGLFWQPGRFWSGFLACPTWRADRMTVTSSASYISASIFPGSFFRRRQGIHHKVSRALNQPRFLACVIVLRWGRFVRSPLSREVYPLIYVRG